LPFTDEVTVEGAVGAEAAAGPACIAATTAEAQELAPEEKMPSRPAVRHSQETTLVVAPYPTVGSDDASRDEGAVGPGLSLLSWLQLQVIDPNATATSAVAHV
jgi:hypothetical protein